MKIADKRHPSLDGDGAAQHRTPAWMHHIECDCGVTFGHEPARGVTCTCPSCKAVEDVAGADVSPIGGAQ